MLKNLSFVTFLIAASPVFANQEIVGGWHISGAGAAQSEGVLTFLGNGSYFWAEDGDSLLDPNGQDGMERGTYSWDPISGEMSLLAIVDTNGEWGWDGATFTPSIIGDSMAIILPDDNLVLSRVVDSGNAMVGSWHFTPASGAGGEGIITFLSNGTYFHVEDGPDNDQSGYDGVERGTYTWNSTNNKLLVHVLLDTNGDWGFSDLKGDVYINVAGNQMTFTEPLTGDEAIFTRVAPVPEPETYALLLAGMGLLAFKLRCTNKRNLIKE